MDLFFSLGQFLIIFSTCKENSYKLILLFLYTLQGSKHSKNEENLFAICVPLAEYNILAQGNLISVIAALALYVGIRSVYILMLVLVFYLLVLLIVTIFKGKGTLPDRNDYNTRSLNFCFFFRNAMVVDLPFWPNHTIHVCFLHVHLSVKINYDLPCTTI